MFAFDFYIALRVFAQQCRAPRVVVGRGARFRIEVCQRVERADAIGIHRIEFLEQFRVIGALDGVVAAEVAQRIDLHLFARGDDHRDAALFVDDVVESGGCHGGAHREAVVPLLVGNGRIDDGTSFGREHLQVDRVFADSGEGSRDMGFVLLSAGEGHQGRCRQ